MKNLIKNKLLLYTTIIPTALSAIYFGFIASDVYISESRFVVRSPERQNPSPLGLMLKNSGFSKSQDDSFTVQDFILSRDALRSLESELKVSRLFGSTNIDIFNRFSPLGSNNTFEALNTYYKNKVDIQLDSSSSISTLTTKAFTADSAYAINQKLLELSEKLINQLNERGREDIIKAAKRELIDAENKAQASALALAKYRNKNNVIDPEKQSTIPLQASAKLKNDLTEIRIQIAQIKSLAKENPQIELLERRAALIEQEMDIEASKVTGGIGSLADKTAEYERLLIEKEFSERILASSLNALEQAKVEAQRKQLYLERIVQPNKPDFPLEPRRLRAVLTTLTAGLLAWGILSLLITGVKEHLD